MLRSIIVITIILISTFNVYGKVDKRPELYKKHFACVGPYLNQIKEETIFKKVKNKNVLNKIIDDLPLNFDKVYTNGRVKHYMKQARELSERSTRVFKEQIQLNHKNVNLNLLIPEYCFENLKNLNNSVLQYDIKDYLKNENFKYEGFKNGITGLLVDAIGDINTFSKKTINSTSYRKLLKDNSHLKFPVKYAKCFDEADFSIDYYKTKFNNALSKLYNSQKEHDFKEILNENEKFLKFSHEQILLGRESPFYLKGKNYLQVPEGHEYYKYNDKVSTATKNYIEALNSAVDELYNLDLVILFYATTKNANSEKFEFMKEQSLCVLKERYFKNNAIVDGYLTSGEANKILRSLN